MANSFITFNAINPYSHLLLITASTDGKDLPVFGVEAEAYVANKNAVLFSTADIVEDFDAPLRVVIGNIRPSKMKRLLSVQLDSKSGQLYIGDVRKETYSLLSLPKGSISLSVYADAENEAKYFYIYTEVHQMHLEKRLTLYEPSEDVAIKIAEIGKKNGCHICGSKSEVSYIPHLLPPLEVDIDGEKKWYPICRTDYTKYQAEIHTMLRSLV